MPDYSVNKREQLNLKRFSEKKSMNLRVGSRKIYPAS